MKVGEAAEIIGLRLMVARLLAREAAIDPNPKGWIEAEQRKLYTLVDAMELDLQNTVLDEAIRFETKDVIDYVLDYAWKQTHQGASDQSMRSRALTIDPEEGQ
jgi:hypothetical protein